jgi:hypothetical protein
MPFIFIIASVVYINTPDFNAHTILLKHKRINTGQTHVRNNSIKQTADSLLLVQPTHELLVRNRLKFSRNMTVLTARNCPLVADKQLAFIHKAPPCILDIYVFHAEMQKVQKKLPFFGKNEFISVLLN